MSRTPTLRTDRCPIDVWESTVNNPLELEFIKLGDNTSPGRRNLSRGIVLFAAMLPRVDKFAVSGREVDNLPKGFKCLSVTQRFICLSAAARDKQTNDERSA